MNSDDWWDLLEYAGQMMYCQSVRGWLEGPPERPGRAWERLMQRRQQQRRLEIREQNRRHGRALEFVYRLTETGQQRADDSWQARQAWARAWDGTWRLFVFDLPQRDRPLRLRLWRWLQSQRFGNLQGSVWITPDDRQELVRSLTWFRNNPAQFILLQSNQLPGVDNHALVQSAWDWERLRENCQQHSRRLQDWHHRAAAAQTPQELSTVVREERRAYRRLLRQDPLLPRCLWPKNYPGPALAQARQDLRAAIGRHLGHWASHQHP